MRTDVRGACQGRATKSSGEGGQVAFDVGGYVRRARRLADLSQRDLADTLGLSRAAVGRLETRPVRVDIPTMESILALAGLRLAVVDPEGRAVARGLAGYSSDDLRRIAGVRSADIESILGYKYLDEAVHRDALVVLEEIPR